MKLKNRMLITSAAMLALIAVSGTTATYAWWTATLESKATVSTMTAVADGSLTVEYEALIGLTESATVNGEFTNATNASLTDVSTANGSTFYKAAMDVDGSTIKSIDEIEDLTKTYANNIYYVYQFKATIKMTGVAGRTYNIYLGDGKGTTKMIDGKNVDYPSARASVVNADGTRRKIYEQTGAKHAGGCDITLQDPNNVDESFESGVEHEVIPDGGMAEKTATVKDDTVANNCFGTIKSDDDEIVLTFTMYFEGAETPKAPVEVTKDTFTANFYLYALEYKETATV